MTMLTVTESALGHLADALDKIEEPKPPGTCFRIVPAEDGKLTLSIGTPKGGDAEYEQGGKPILVVSEEVRAQCEGRTLDADGRGNLLLT